MKIESIQVIPMNKESIFDEPYVEDEIHGCTLNVKEWEEQVLPRLALPFDEKNIDGLYGHDLTPPPNVSEIARLFKGYMFGPVAKYGKEVLEARSYTFESFDDVGGCDFSNCFLYTIGKRLHDGNNVIRYASIRNVV